MNRQIGLLKILPLIFLLGIPFSIFASANIAQASSTSPAGLHLPVNSASPMNLKNAFAFVSNFETKTLEGWKSVNGTAPTVVTKPNYSGEPALKSSASGGAQFDVANQGFITGLKFISFQVAIQATSSSAYFGLGDNTNPVAIVGVSGGYVVAGGSISSAKQIEKVPTKTAYPSGWVYITANVFKNTTGYYMQVFADRTDQTAATVFLPHGGSYNDGLIATTTGTAYYTNIVISTYEIPSIIPGYNNMDGYGQGSGLLVELLPAFYNLTAVMTLDNWSVPQNNILSFQINAMNYVGTTESTCKGFFQLGVDLSTGGRIAPWYVPGVNCVAHYFAGKGGVSTPAGSKLILSIINEESAKKILFVIKDLATSETFSTTISYHKSMAFYGSYTQMEFQPCCADYPISDYKLKGSLFDMQITTNSGITEFLPASYMIPFVLDTPPTWDLTYYQNSTAGYVQKST